ncbi:DUF484 family protein [Undibacterium oligocarboniphilum]|uniref:DUF484 family protein n=2 Tax=Undibacterium oligocarboniphilum TaxID=666702 RepID=A0A850QAU7_9BURK|nr:DUF484 family protein [Undibacterium oligocarboniphilum]MBC3870968.1 DUF484 family protein [Undibacterium oligocarboniphilum]NVO76409.1 DUF484 family protein [Undibacterium oligocarboniphilum]
MIKVMNSTDIATYLVQHPHFFEEHAELLSSIKLTSPVMGRAISLQERQMEVVREKYRALELRLAELMRIAEDNHIITRRFQSWTRSLLLARNDVDLPHILTQGLQDIFDLPHATLRLWNVAADFSHTWFSSAVSEDAMLFAKGLSAPFCGPNQDFEAAGWIEAAEPLQSIAMLPLRQAPGAMTFGLLVLGSPDPARYTKDMATDFLVQIADTSSAALSCLIDQ